MFQPQFSQLETGLTVIKIPMQSLRSVTALSLIKTGSRYEEASQFGTAHFLEHLVFKGTRSYPSQLELAIKLDSVGASSNAFTSKEYTGFYVTAASRHTALGLEIIKELIFAPLLKEEDIAREKPVILEEIKMHQDAPDEFIAQEFERLVYQGSGLEHPISGSEQSVRAVSHTQLQKFLNKWYGLGNMVLILAGDADYLNSRQPDQDIQQIFGLQPEEREDNYQQQLQKYLTDRPYGKSRLLVKQRDTAQAHFSLGWPALKRDDPQRYVLSVLSTVLGGNRSSRLFHEIREQMSLAYYIYSDVDQYTDGGVLGAKAGVNVERVVEAVQAVTAEFYKIARGESPVERQELAKAKNYLTGRVVLSLESSQAVAQYYGLRQLLLDRVEDPDDVIEKIQAVTAKEVQALASRLLKPDKLRLAVIGPFKDEKKFEEVLEKGVSSN